jgi:hypothetical protein
MSERGTSTGLPIAWEWCKRHDWKSEKVVCPFCRAERAERKLDEARKALLDVYEGKGLFYLDSTLAAIAAARAAAKDEGSGALHIGTPFETDHGGGGGDDPASE